MLREAISIVFFVSSCCAVELILIQQHYNGEQFFARTWEEFKSEFGTVYGGYWIGNERLHELTSTGKYYLRVDMQSRANEKLYKAFYKTFIVGPASDGYRLTIGNYSGTAGDALYSLDQMRFTTRDRDNDKRSGGNCADMVKGGFWYNNCAWAFLNGIYKETTDEGGFSWNTLPVTGKTWLNYDRMYLVAFDPCDSKPCLNGGTCRTEGDEFTCSCAEGFAGDRCQKDDAECKSTAPEDRINCGWGGVTSSECSQRSCCYDTTYTNHPYCFYQSAECSAIDAAHRVDCGFDGINYPQCIGRGCCYDDDPATNPTGPICFRKAAARCVGVPASERIEQGDPTMHPNVCLANGWCFDTSAEPNCFSVATQSARAYE